jgi:selenocysteine lyase/cysteine desulfurase
MVGAAAAVDFLAGLAGPSGPRRERLARVFAALHERGEALLAALWSGLSALPRVRCYGPPPGAPRTPTVAFSVEGTACEDVARALAARGVFVSHGSFYAEDVLARLGRTREGLVRAGCACYTTAEEVERLIAGVRALAAS